MEKDESVPFELLKEDIEKMTVEELRENADRLEKELSRLRRETAIWKAKGDFVIGILPTPSNAMH